MSLKSCLFLITCFCFLSSCHARIQAISLLKDDRSYIQLSSFGYLKGGILKMNIAGLTTKNNSIDKNIGFTFDKSSSEGRSSYVEHQEDVQGCALFEADAEIPPHSDTKRAIMRLEKLKDTDEYELVIYTMGMENLKIEDYKNKDTDMQTTMIEQTRQVTPTEISQSTILTTTLTSTSNKKPNKKPKKKMDNKNPVLSHNSKANKTATHLKKIPSENHQKGSSPLSRKRRDVGIKFNRVNSIPVYMKSNKDQVSFSLALVSVITTEEQEGLYELYFHDCRKYNYLTVSGFINITEMNGENYLSAGDICLPIMYAVMSSLFFFMAFQWISVLCVSKGKVFMIHYMMALLVVIKGLSLAFHSIDLYFISKDGTPETWAIIFYVVHLLKGVLLFICLLLIGTGWAFIKYVLSDREKKLFMIVIPLQVFANIAYIVIHDTSESSRSYYTWKNVMILVDILCCGAILVPVVWSVRHLQEASQTDGKAALSLKKLKLFQSFYVMIICYLYFTRLIVYLLEITLPFHYIWIHMLFSELGSLIFFFLTGYQFRPGCDNPYLSVPNDDFDDVESTALTESGATESIFRVNKFDRDAEDTTEEDLLLPEWRVAAAKTSNV